MIVIEPDGTSDADTLAELVGLTARRIRQLAREGVLPKVARGRYPVAECIQAYIGYWQQRAERSSNGGGPGWKEARARKTTVEVEIKELELAERRRELVPVEDVEAMVSDALDPVDLGLRTAPRQLAGTWSGRLECSEGEAVHLIRDLCDGLRDHLVSAMRSGGRLPEDFPHRGILEAAGVETVRELRQVADLTEIHGIGPARAKEIREAVNGS